MKKKLIKNLGFLVLLNLIVKPLYVFGIDIAIQNAVGAQEYGRFFPYFKFALMLNILLDMGLENFIRREIARHNQLLSKYFSYSFTLKLLLGIVYFSVSLIIGLCFDNLELKDIKLLIIILLNQFLASFILYLRSLLGGMHQFIKDSILSVLDRIVIILLCGGMLLNNYTRFNFKIEWLVYAQSIGYIVSLILAFIFVLWNTTYFKPSFHYKFYLVILKKSYPYALLILLMGIYINIDTYLVKMILPDGKYQAGIYAHSIRLVDMFANYGYLFAIILLPIFAKMIKQGKNIQEILKLSFYMLFIPAITVAIGCSFFSEEIISLLYPKESIETSSEVFRILIFSFTGICITYIFGSLLTANGNLKQLNIMALVAVILAFNLNAILISKLGIKGASYSNLFVQIFTSILQILLVLKIFKLRINTKLIVQLLLYIIIIVIAGLGIKLIQTNWLIQFICFFIFASIIIFVSKLIRIKKLYYLIFNTSEEV